MLYYILRADLVNHPSEVGAIRAVALVATTLDLRGLVEAEADSLDIYYKFFKDKYLTDFFRDFVRPEEAPDAIRIDNGCNFPFSIVTDRIDFRNQVHIIGQLANLAKLRKTAETFR